MKEPIHGVKDGLTKQDNNSLSLSHLIRQMVQFAPGALVPAVIGLLTTGIFTRVFDSVEYGRYSFVLSVTGLVSAIASQWLQQGAARFLPAEEDNLRRQELKQSIAVALGIISVLILLLGLLFLPLEAVWSELAGFSVPGILLTLSTVLFSALLTVLQSELRARRYSTYNLGTVLLRFALSLLIVLRFYRHPSGLLWATLLSQFLVVPLMWRETGLPRLRIWVGQARRVLPDLKMIAFYGLPLTGWFLAGTLLNVGDRYVIQIVRGSAEVGIYSANYSLVYGAVGLLSAPVLLAAHPFVMRAWNNGDKEAAGYWLARIVEWFCTAGTLLAGGVAIYASDFANWFLGPEFRAGYHIMPVVVAGVIVWQLGMYAHKPLEFTGRTGLMLWLAVGSAVVNMVLNVVLVPVGGYAAAAYTTLISYVLYAVVALKSGQGILPWKVEWRRLITALSTAVVGLAVAGWIKVTVQARVGYLPALIASAAMAILVTVLAAIPIIRPLIRSKQ